MTAIAGCRACGCARLEAVLSLGDMPLVNVLLDDVNEKADRFPLDVVRCPRCTLVQITETIPPDLLFREYAYFSSFSDTFLAHARAFAARMRAELELGPGSLVIEAASNDGYLLRFFAEEGIPVLGIEPARNVAAVASGHGIETVPEFLNAEVARTIVANRSRRADLVVANNVLAHVADLHGFVGALATLVGDTGLISVEVPHVCELIDRVEFDTIYHEHLCYFSLTALVRLFAEHALTVVDVEPLLVHGGSLRVLARAGGSPSPAVAALLEREEKWGVEHGPRYQEFASTVESLRKSIGSTVRDLVAAGERVAGYGAAAKAVVLLNTCGLDRSVVDYVVDRNPYKQGKFLPGVRIPVRSPDALLETRPGFVIIFVWNVATEVIEQQRPYLQGGGHFVIPVPELRVVA